MTSSKSLLESLKGGLKAEDEEGGDGGGELSPPPLNLPNNQPSLSDLYAQTFKQVKT